MLWIHCPLKFIIGSFFIAAKAGQQFFLSLYRAFNYVKRAVNSFFHCRLSVIPQVAPAEDTSIVACISRSHLYTLMRFNSIELALVASAFPFEFALGPMADFYPAMIANCAIALVLQQQLDICKSHDYCEDTNLFKL